MLWYIFLLVTSVKLLLIPTYRSTDFEVHRNWLAVTHSLPVKQWYNDTTSEWTLDYPPFFAWFEYLLSHFAQFFDPEMLKVTNLNYASNSTVLFQRLSVIVADLMLAFGTKECCVYLSASGVRKSSKWKSRWKSPATVLQVLLLCNAGLLLVDHIHFQYNGMLFGVLLMSIAKMLQGSTMESAIWFCILLNFKHIFAYVAPAYFVYLLRNHCFDPTQPVTWSKFSVTKFCQLSMVVASIFMISFGPFIMLGQFAQVMSRLFPFKRGLCHAYWAPNFWALYNTADKAATVVGKTLGLNLQHSSAVMTGGLVQEFEHTVLPSVSPKMTFVLTLVSVLPAIMKLWYSPGNPLHFVRCVVLCAGASFIFGWHVHEKAILMVIIPLSLMAVVWKKEAQAYLLLAVAGHYSLFPLIFTAAELPIKILLLLLHSVYSFFSLSGLFDVQGMERTWALPLMSKAESAYLFGLFPLFIFETVVHSLLNLKTSLPFLPLLLTSVYCSIGIIYAWLKYYQHFLSTNEVNHKRKAH